MNDVPLPKPLAATVDDGVAATFNWADIVAYGKAMANAQKEKDVQMFESLSKRYTLEYIIGAIRSQE